MLSACCVVVECSLQGQPYMVMWRAFPAEDQLRFLLFTLAVSAWCRSKVLS